jgi:hypothetical protein
MSTLAADTFENPRRVAARVDMRRAIVGHKPSLRGTARHAHPPPRDVWAWHPVRTGYHGVLNPRREAAGGVGNEDAIAMAFARVGTRHRSSPDRPLGASPHRFKNRCHPARTPDRPRLDITDTVRVKGWTTRRPRAEGVAKLAPGLPRGGYPAVLLRLSAPRPGTTVERAGERRRASDAVGRACS